MRRWFKRYRPLLLAAAVASAAAAIALATLFTRGGDGPPSAVIVDQLSLSQPNPRFAEEATALLERAGYEVDYVSGEEATVELYRRLPAYGYDIVLVRAHAGRRIDDDGKLTDYAHLFTGEPYSPADHLDEQRDGHLQVVAYDEASVAAGEAFFGIPESFVSETMLGDFDGAAVVLMGCDVLRADALAGAFAGRGAGAVIGWDDQVSAAHTDAATLALLRYVVDDAMSIEEAAAAAAAELGPDPAYGAELVSYPGE